MNPFALVRDGVIWVEEVLLALAVWCLGFGWPLEGLGSWFGDLAYGASNIAGFLSIVADWYDQIQSDIAKMLGWEGDIALWQSVVLTVFALIAWWLDWVHNVTGLVENWWETVKPALEDKIMDLRARLADQQVAWDRFWLITFPTLISWVSLEWWWGGKHQEISDEVDGKFIKWFPFYNELAAIWADIKQLFDDPEKWLLDKIESMLARFL